MPWVLYAFESTGFVVGLILGSFLNVCIVRVPRGESVIRPGSHCMFCGHPVRWFDNLPIVSWLLLRGRCRDCRARISWRYPAVELASGLWFTWTAGRPLQVHSHALDGSTPVAGLTIGTLSIAIFGWLLIGLIVIDWLTQRLPDAFTLSGIVIGLFLVCTQAVFLGPTDDQIVLNGAKQLRLASPGSFAGRGNVFLTGPESLIFGRLAAVCGAALILLLVRWAYKRLRGREGLGLGDVKLLAMVAAFLGFWPAVLTLFLSVVLASLFAVTLLVRGKAASNTRLPLGSFLGVAGFLTVLWGEPVLLWYRGLLK